jgi:CHAT domain-containing protein
MGALFKDLRDYQKALKVDDRATAELMKRFYSAMHGKDALRPAAALRAAQVQMWKTKGFEDPYYWAAFTLQGEWK